MNIKESESDQYGTFLSGLAYSGVLAIILLMFCFAINQNLFDSNLTYLTIGILCIAFFASGLKKVDEKNLGFLSKLGKRHFDEYYSEGWWWIFPIWKFNQKPHFNILNEGEELQLKFITSDEIPVDINIKYYWQLKNPEDSDNKYTTSFIRDTLKHELGIFVRSHHAIELLSDKNISNKVMINYLVKAGEGIGITISSVFPNINFESQYIPIVRKYQEKYKELQFQLNEMLLHQKVKATDIKIYEDQIFRCINNLGLSSNDAMNFIKVYKNNINMRENTINITDLNKVIDSVISALKNK